MDIQIQSMTGFGRAQIETPTLRAVCEIKALNGRYFEADLRLPKFLYEIDAQIRRQLNEKLERGTITCTYSITFPNVKAEDQTIHINAGLAKAYLDKYQELSSSLGVEFRDPFREIIRIPEGGRSHGGKIAFIGGIDTVGFERGFYSRGTAQARLARSHLWPIGRARECRTAR
jgi:uncharacterized protein YicC (UPF0701 family)